MKKINSLLVADSILALLGTMVTDKEGFVFVENFTNGREQGFTIVDTSQKTKGESLNISFAESRNSDQVVVRTNETNSGVEKFFSTIVDAANFIQSKLIK